MALEVQVKRVRATLCERGAIKLTSEHDPAIARVIDYIEAQLKKSKVHSESDTPAWDLAIEAISQMPRPAWVRELIGSELLGPLPESDEV
jgi:hypothetical protein